MGLETLCAINDGQRVDIGNRTLSYNGSSLRTVVPQEICHAKGLEEGDELRFQYDKKHDEIVIPIDGGETDK